MKRLVTIVLFIVIILAALLIGGYQYLMYSTKKHSPLQQTTHVTDGTEIKLKYSSPSVRDRVIFGEVVPFGEVWRTGANEPTTVTFTAPVGIAGATLEAGTYSLWTVPGPDRWTIILNARDYDWGMGWSGESPRKPEYDVVNAEVPVIALDSLQEKLLITVSEDPPALDILWEYTKVSLPTQP